MSNDKVDQTKNGPGAKQEKEVHKTPPVPVQSPATEPAKKSEYKKIGNFLIGKTKGKGTFGKVKQGTHEPTGEKVAIKILEKEKIKDHADLERINREITILKKLYDMIENNEYLYLIMEYCSGGELFQHIVKNRKLKEEEACKMYAQILSGIEYIHKLGVVHRDLKPENLLLDHNNNIKLVDFGLSNLYKEGERLKTACGSPCYAAPEMIKGERYYGLGADIWSSGVILYAMVAGYLPFEDQNTKKLYQKIIKAEYKMPSQLSSIGQDLVTKILQPDPTKRYTIEDIRNHDWFKICKHQPPYTPAIFLGKEPIPIDPKIVGTLEKDHKIDPSKTESEIKRNKFNNVTTTYYLLLKRKERAGIFRQQYNDEVKALLRRKGPKATPGNKPAEIQISGGNVAPADIISPKATHAMSPVNQPGENFTVPGYGTAMNKTNRPPSPTSRQTGNQRATPNAVVGKNMVVIAPTTVKKQPDSTRNAVQMLPNKKAKNISLQLDEANSRIDTHTPGSLVDDMTDHSHNTQPMRISSGGDQPPAPRARRMNNSEDPRKQYQPLVQGQRGNAMNSTMNRGFNVQQIVRQTAENTNFHIPGSTRNANKIRVGGGQGVDPFGKINPKARKLVESVERHRQNTSERRTGSTGGSSMQQVELENPAGPQGKGMNQTGTNFYQANKGIAGKKRTANGLVGPRIQIQIPGAPQTQRGGNGAQAGYAPSYQNYLFSETTSPHYRSPSSNSNGPAIPGQSFTPLGQATNNGTYTPGIPGGRKQGPANNNLFHKVPYEGNAQNGSNPMQIISQLSGGSKINQKIRSFSRAYEPSQQSKTGQGYYSKQSGTRGKGSNAARRGNQTLQLEDPTLQIMDFDQNNQAPTTGSAQTVQQPGGFSNHYVMTKPMLHKGGQVRVQNQPFSPNATGGFNNYQVQGNTVKTSSAGYQQYSHNPNTSIDADMNLTPNEVATFYSNQLTTQHIINSRRNNRFQGVSGPKVSNVQNKFRNKNGSPTAFNKTFY